MIISLLVFLCYCFSVLQLRKLKRNALYQIRRVRRQQEMLHERRRRMRNRRCACIIIFLSFMMHFIYID